MLCRFSIFFMNTHIFSILNVEGVSSVKTFTVKLQISDIFGAEEFMLCNSLVTSSGLINFKRGGEKKTDAGRTTVYH